jgi:hypothetical protein
MAAASTGKEIAPLLQRARSLFRKGFTLAGSIVGLVQMVWRSFPRVFHLGEDAQFIVDVWTRLGGDLSVLIQMISSPLFGLGILVSSLGYAIYDNRSAPKSKETEKVISVVGWVFVGICVALITSVYMFESFVTQTHIIQLVDEAAKERHVTSVQKQQIKEALAPALSNFPVPITVSAADNPEANGYAIEIMKALAEAGAKVQSQTLGMVAPFPMRALDTGVKGIFFQVRDRNNPPIEVRTLILVFAAADIKSTIYNDPVLSDRGYILTIGLK